jgi:putrescine transport system permease protein
MRQNHYFLKTCLFIGFAFFYIPIFSMIFFSFNKSRLVTVWGGFSTEWYFKLFANTQVINAAILSLEIALVSATVATVLGTMAGIALARFRRFRGRTLFSGFVTAPLIMPEVITGISMLMLFILMGQYIGWPGKRGFTTVTIAHITFSLTFVTTIVQSRLSSMDISIEEAAMDLGSKPWQVLKDVTLPIIAPAIMSGWLLAFTISLDDVVITNFTTGPGATTLPILIWSKVKLGVTPDINALASLIIIVVGICVGIAGILMNRAERRRERDIHLATAANE